MSVRSVQHDNVREYNRLAVLDNLRKRGVASRAELSRATELSIPTVTTIGQEFVSLGLVHEGDFGPSGGGRPARLLKLIPSTRNVLAIDLSGPKLSAARVDLAGELHPLAPGPSLAPGLEKPLLEWLAAELAAAEAAATPISALALAVPGVVDFASSKVRLAPSLAWHDADVGKLLRESSGLPVLLENDVNALALGETTAGVGKGHLNVVFLAIASGIGAGLIVDGKLFRGAHHAAGEVGYTLLPGLPEAGLDLGASGPLERHLLDIAEGCVSGGQLTLDNTEAEAAFDELVAGVRLLLHNVTCVVDPELIVVAWTADPEGLLAKRIGQRWTGTVPVDVRAGSLGASAALHGVGRLALSQLLERICGLERTERSFA